MKTGVRMATSLHAPDTTDLCAELAAQRARTLALVSHLDEATLQSVVDPLMSPLVWDLGHIAAYEDLWLVHRHGDLPLLRDDLMGVYDAFETPRAVRGDIAILGPDDARDYLAAVRARTLSVIDSHGVDPVLHELVLRHEMQHTETMRQTMTLGGLLPEGEPSLRPVTDADGAFTAIPAGVLPMGAGPDRFSYDNERPRHDVPVGPFTIARSPVTNATWLSFSEGGGYERREWWSSEGWAWKEEYDISRPAEWDQDGPRRAHDEPVQHVSWFEADAFARAHGARLPTEAEWERAATWNDGTSIADVGQVWEWTTSPFTGYPGFVAHPYREYSEVFFGDAYRVLRGGSWAADKRVATATFRNWDLPRRRQIFAGVRLVRDVEA